MALFANDEWVEALKKEVNSNKEMPKAGKGFDAHIQFIISNAGKRGELTFWTHMKDGTILEISSGGMKNPDYKISGDYAVWQEIVKGEQDPIQAIMLKKLVFEGNMQVIIRYIKAVNLLMESVKNVKTEF